MPKHFFGAPNVRGAWLQPSYFEDFRCIGDSCEDTCCQGMVIHVDQTTFAKYQACSHPELKPKLERLVQILPEPTAFSYATIQLENARCSFHQGGLCSIQSKLGEDHLSRVCATYPRVLHAIVDSRERSLGLSCPEAARLVLDRRDPVTFEGWPDSSESNGRRLILSVLQNRRYSISRRILLVGHICSKISELEQTEQIHFPLGHTSVQTTKRYLRCKQRVSGGIKGSQFGRFRWVPASAEIASRRTSATAA